MRMWDIALEHFHNGWWGNDVVLTHNQQGGGPQGTDLLGGQSGDCHLVAWGIEGANLLIQESLCRLLLRKVPGIGAWRRVHPAQCSFTFGAQLRHAGVTKASRC